MAESRTSKPVVQFAEQFGRPEGATLREKKRALVRLALSEAALRLALERGLDQVYVPDIAAEIGVSPRTFNNYFASKEEAVVARAFDLTAQLLVSQAVDSLAARPASEPLWEAITQAILEQFPANVDLDAGMVMQAQLLRDTPGLWGEMLKMFSAIEWTMGQAIADRLGTDVDDDLLPQVAASAAIGASRIALDHWLDSPDTRSFRSVLAKALELAEMGNRVLGNDAHQGKASR